MRRARRISTTVVTILLVGACAPEPEPAACGPVEHPPFQTGGHLVGDAEPPVEYSSTPGTSGWHTGGTPRTGVLDEPLPEPEIVAVLERGQVVAAYDPDRLPTADVELLEEAARGRFRDELTVTPFDGMDAPLVLNSLGTRQACDQLDTEVLERFVEREDPPEAH